MGDMRKNAFSLSMRMRLASISESKVPASVQRPTQMSYWSWPRAMYALLTLVISSSPRAEG